MLGGEVEKETIRRIRLGSKLGSLHRDFTPQEVNALLGIDWAGTFLPKHRVGNPGGYTELFLRIGRGLYRLRDQP